MSLWVVLMREKDRNDYVLSIHRSKAGAMMKATETYMRQIGKKLPSPLDDAAKEHVEMLANEYEEYFTCLSQFEDKVCGKFQFYTELDTRRFLVYETQLQD
jgi:hypothetical protein